MIRLLSSVNVNEGTRPPPLSRALQELRTAGALMRLTVAQFVAKLARLRLHPSYEHFQCHKRIFRGKVTILIFSLEIDRNPAYSRLGRASSGSMGMGGDDQRFDTSVAPFATGHATG
jgi:hypothetical protein